MIYCYEFTILCTNLFSLFNFWNKRSRDPTTFTFFLLWKFACSILFYIDQILSCFIHVFEMDKWKYMTTKKIQELSS